MNNLNWIEIKYNGDKVPARCMHSSALLDSKLIIFGGINDNGLLNSDLFILELDDYKS